MEVTTLPKGLTRGYANSWLDSFTPSHKEKVLTIKDLDALDAETLAQVDSGHETA